MSYLFLLLLQNKKNGKPMKTARSEFTILKQICELVPAHLVTHLARKYGVEDKFFKYPALTGIKSFEECVPVNLPENFGCRVFGFGSYSFSDK